MYVYNMITLNFCGMSELVIGSLNVRGMRSYAKRNQVFQLLKLENTDIVFLQETHCCNIKEGKNWGNLWPGKAFWSFGTFHSGGVGILLSPNLQYNVVNFVFDYKGQFLILDIDVNNIGYRLINVYAPNNASERRVFISDMSKILVTKRNIIFGGNFNFVENVGLDKCGGNLEFGDIGSKEINV